MAGTVTYCVWSERSVDTGGCRRVDGSLTGTCAEQGEVWMRGTCASMGYSHLWYASFWCRLPAPFRVTCGRRLMLSCAVYVRACVRACVRAWFLATIVLARGLSFWCVSWRRCRNTGQRTRRRAWPCTRTSSGWAPPGTTPTMLLETLLEARPGEKSSPGWSRLRQDRPHARWVVCAGSRSARRCKALPAAWLRLTLLSSTLLSCSDTSRQSLFFVTVHRLLSCFCRPCCHGHDSMVLKAPVA